MEARHEPHSPVPASERLAQLDGSTLELTDIPIRPAQVGVAHNRVLRREQIADLPSEQRGTLLSLCYDLFVEHWDQIVFGTCIQGAVYELQLGQKPEQFSYLDGYLTVFLDPSPAHMHLCIGAHQGLKQETHPELARQRQCSRAVFARTLGQGGQPHSWSVQLFNGAGEQMITFFLPSPFMDKTRTKRLKQPDYSHLALWNDLRARYLGEQAPQALPAGRERGTCS